ANSVLGPLRLVNEAMGGGKRLPATRAQASNLYFFLEGEAGMTALLAPGRKEALIQLRVRGDARPTVEALERFVASELHGRPRWPRRDDVAERVAYILQSGGRLPDRDQLRRTLRVIAAPGDADPAWTERRVLVARAFFASEEAPPLSAQVR